MPRIATRRPVPALVFLLALGLLSAGVWWRVLNRSNASSTNAPTVVATSSLSCSAPGQRRTLPKASAVTVKVRNGAGRDGLAAQVSGELKARGFVIIGYDTAPSSMAGVAQIQFGSNAHPAATLLAYELPGSVLVPITRTTAQIDVVLGSQFKALASTKAAAAALKAVGSSC